MRKKKTPEELAREAEAEDEDEFTSECFSRVTKFQKRQCSIMQAHLDADTKLLNTHNPPNQNALQQTVFNAVGTNGNMEQYYYTSGFKTKRKQFAYGNCYLMLFV